MILDVEELRILGPQLEGGITKFNPSQRNWEQIFEILSSPQNLMIFLNIRFFFLMFQFVEV